MIKKKMGKRFSEHEQELFLSAKEYEEFFRKTEEERKKIRKAIMKHGGFINFLNRWEKFIQKRLRGAGLPDTATLCVDTREDYFYKWRPMPEPPIGESAEKIEHWIEHYSCKEYEVEVTLSDFLIQAGYKYDSEEHTNARILHDIQQIKYRMRTLSRLLQSADSNRRVCKHDSEGQAPNINFKSTDDTGNLIDPRKIHLLGQKGETDLRAEKNFDLDTALGLAFALGKDNTLMLVYETLKSDSRKGGKNKFKPWRAYGKQLLQRYPQKTQEEILNKIPLSPEHEVYGEWTFYRDIDSATGEEFLTAENNETMDYALQIKTESFRTTYLSKKIKK